MTGAVGRPGCYEAPLGITTRRLVDDYAGGFTDEPGAIVPGGAASGILPPAALDVPLTRDALAEWGAGVGSAAVQIFPRSYSPLRLLAETMRFFAEESCQKCTPCRIGNRALHAVFAGERAMRSGAARRVARGNGADLDLRARAGGADPGPQRTAPLARARRGATRMSAELMRLLSGFRPTQALHVAASLGIADLLAGGPRASDELATESGAHPDSLYRLLRALASIGVLEEDDARRFALTPLGEPLRSDVPGSLHGWALLIGRPYFWSAWGNLEHSIRSGENSFRSLHGTDVWDWRADRPEESAIFDDAMASLTGATNRAVLEAYDFGRFGMIVDVGGGNRRPAGRDSRRSPDRAWRALRPAARGRRRGRGLRVGRRSLQHRGRHLLRVCAGGGDAYLLKMIIHDWEDEEAIAILRVCRAAMSTEARLLVIERILAPPNEGPEGKFSDLNMLVMPGGRERTEAEFAALFERSGSGSSRPCRPAQAPP